MSKKKISEKASNIYEMLQQYQAVNGFYPSIRELAEIFDLSDFTVRYHLQKLQDAKYINRVQNKSRAYEIL